MGVYRRISELSAVYATIYNYYRHTPHILLYEKQVLVTNVTIYLRIVRFSTSHYAKQDITSLHHNDQNRRFRIILWVSSWWVNTQIYAMYYELNNQFKTCVFNIIRFCFSFLTFALFKETYSDFTQFLYVLSPSFSVKGTSVIP